ncbi:MAG TPA: FkbM family methyltransferase [candidate division Zixibacteria bacterium]|nr:FkbM family methyltransferase [candidate division Zixibacteria bacterium]
MSVFIDAFEECYQQFPILLADIGASGGIPVEWEQASRFLQVIAFEPDKQAFANLLESEKQLSSIKYLNAALYEEQKTVGFYLTEQQTNSSMFRPNRAFLDRFPNPDRFEILNTVQLEVSTLDNQLSERKITDLDFIKLDTQGSELAILKGAAESLSGSVFGLAVEVEFVPIYQEQPLFSDVDSFIRGFGFQLFDLAPCYWKRIVGRLGKGYIPSKGQIIFADAVYFRKAEHFLESLDGSGNLAWKRAKALKAVSISALYGHLDYAIEIGEYARQVRLLSDHEFDLLRKHFEDTGSFLHEIPNFRGRGRIANLFYSIYKVLRPSYHRHWYKYNKLEEW